MDPNLVGPKNRYSPDSCKLTYCSQMMVCTVCSPTKEGPTLCPSLSCFWRQLPEAHDLTVQECWGLSTAHTMRC